MRAGAWAGVLSIALLPAGCVVDGEPYQEPETQQGGEQETASPDQTLDLEAEVTAILSADPTLCGTEMTAVLRIIEDQMGTLVDEDETSALVTSACEDIGTFADQESEPTESPSEYPSFGETYDWTDGVSVAVSEPAEFTPSEYSAVPDAEMHLRFTVTIINHSGAEFDPSMATVTLQSGSREAQEVFDLENEVGGWPEGLLLDGREVSYDVGFGVDDPADLVLQISPSWDHEPAIFVTS